MPIFITRLWLNDSILRFGLGWRNVSKKVQIHYRQFAAFNPLDGTYCRQASREGIRRNYCNRSRFLG